MFTIACTIGFFLLLAIPPFALSSILSSSMKVAAHEKQFAADLDTLRRNLEASHSSRIAAAERQLHSHEMITQTNARKQNTAYDKMAKAYREELGIKKSLKEQLVYAKQRINEDRPATTEELEASIQKAHQEVAGLKSSLALALSAVPAPTPIPAAPVATAASDPAAPVCEHQGLMAEKTKLELALAAVQRESTRKDLALTAEATKLAQKERELSKKSEEVKERDEKLAAMEQSFRNAVEAEVSRQTAELSKQYDGVLVEEVSKKEAELTVKYNGILETEVSRKEAEKEAELTVKYNGILETAIAATRTSQMQTGVTMAADHDDKVAKLKQEHKDETAEKDAKTCELTELVRVTAGARDQHRENYEHIEKECERIQEIAEERAAELKKNAGTHAQQTVHKSTNQQDDEISRLKAAAKKHFEDMGAMDAEYNHAMSLLKLEKDKVAGLQETLKEHKQDYKDVEKEVERLDALAKQKEQELVAVRATAPTLVLDPSAYDVVAYQRHAAEACSPDYGTLPTVPLRTPRVPNFPPAAPAAAPSVSPTSLPFWAKRGRLGDDEGDEYEDEDDEDDIDDEDGEEEAVGFSDGEEEFTVENQVLE